MKMEENVLSENQFQGAPNILQMTTAEKLSTQMKQGQKILQMMTNEKTNLIFMMRDDRKYIDNAADKMKMKLSLADKALDKSKSLQEKAKDESLQGEKDFPKVLFVRSIKRISKSRIMRIQNMKLFISIIWISKPMKFTI
ncbi:uncharacterized protein LOC128390110 [Panonychus citri]|uniref:uncharacterized protein LOC128390110 n=1 Tax=Panonychus citri TaxID=50023 RepID=UPI00230736F0|nr:uncharacterized protein LOC128390110 [Panonychus citri]